MSDGDSGTESAYPNPVSARVTDETYDKLEAYADKYTAGQITVGAREAIQDGVAGYKQRTEQLERERDELARERDRLRDENEELRARVNSPDVIDWLDVTRNASAAVKTGLLGVVAVAAGFVVALVTVWAEAVVGLSPPGWLLRVALTVSVSGVVGPPVFLGLSAVGRWVGGLLGV